MIKFHLFLFMKIAFIIAIISINLFSQDIGIVISAGPGINTGNLGNWVNSYQMGANLSLDFINESGIYRFSFNPETSEINTKKSIDISGETWPENIQINFMSFQLLYGYPINLEKNQFTFYVGLSINWLDAPNDYDDEFELVGNKNKSTSICFGPSIQFSWKRPIPFWFIYPFDLPFTVETGAIYPGFERLDSDLSGLHLYIKAGVYFGKY